jgi:hypothetical protein
MRSGIPHEKTAIWRFSLFIAFFGFFPYNLNTEIR